MIRELARGGTTVEEMRRAVYEAPVVMVRLDRGGVRFPAVCPNCGAAAGARIRMERAFLFHVDSGDDTPNSTVQSIDVYDVPFCERCVGQHRGEVTAPSPWTPLKRVMSEADGFAALVVMGISLLFFKDALLRLKVVPMLLGCVPLGTGLWLVRKPWKNSRHMTLPKPTSVDSAVDFTPPLWLEFEPAWCAFEFRSEAYAELFRQANEGQLWSRQSREARGAAAQRKEKSFRTNLIVGAVVLAIVVWMLLKG